MTEQHPITPAPELVQQWLGEFFVCVVTGELSDSERYIATQAANWGADQELEACAKHLKRDLCFPDSTIELLRAARRPKPPSLAQKALHILGSHGDLSPKEHDTIRKALEALPE